MKNLVYIYLCCLFTLSCQAQDQSNFSPEALDDTFYTLKGKKVNFNDILESHKGKTVLIDIWASWCKDCIVGMPVVNKLQKKYPDVAFVFLSLDKDQASWERGIKRFKIENGNHYWNRSGWKSPFNTSIDLDWIPRYMIVNPKGEISLFKATKAKDLHIKKTLDQLTK